MLRLGFELPEPKVVVPGFQWAPTLGGECYLWHRYWYRSELMVFRWAPTLGGECYPRREALDPLEQCLVFQWAPTLGGECYMRMVRLCVVSRA